MVLLRYFSPSHLQASVLMKGYDFEFNLPANFSRFDSGVHRVTVGCTVRVESRHRSLAVDQIFKPLRGSDS